MDITDSKYLHFITNQMNADLGVTHNNNNNNNNKNNNRLVLCAEELLILIINFMKKMKSEQALLPNPCLE
jgi:hypothetical protein